MEKGKKFKKRRNSRKKMEKLKKWIRRNGWKKMDQKKSDKINFQ